MSKTLLFSPELIKIIESNNWTLYRINNFLSKMNINDFEKRGPVETCQVDGCYFFLPIPKEGKKLSDVIKKTYGHIPCIDTGEIIEGMNSNIIPLVALEFKKDYILLRQADRNILMPYQADDPYENNNLIGIFKNNFFIKTPERKSKFFD